MLAGALYLSFVQPLILLLEGKGYKEGQRKTETHCKPGTYLPMRDGHVHEAGGSERHFWSHWPADPV